MRLAVHVMVLTDPETRVVQPVGCNTERALAEAALEEARDNLTMGLAFVPTNERENAQSVIDSLRIVSGTLDFAA